jgi:4-hydroxyphenylpyruvate dioxygenase
VELGERAQARGLAIGFEALSWGKWIYDHRDAWSVVRDVNHPAVGLVLDSFHSLARKIPVESLPDIDPTKIFLVQLADAPMIDMDLLSWSRHFRNLPGQGDLAVPAYVALLRARGYDGPWSLEIFNDRFRASPAGTTAVDGMRSLRYLEDQVTRQDGASRSAALPARVRCHGFEFIEFAANEDEVEPLSRMFTALGFTQCGRHRTKDVTRWTQHGVNFVINKEPESFARAYDNVHGASVCALGLSVDDVQGAMQRAQGLQIGSFSQPVGPGELKMPSIRGVGGSLLYFMQRGGEAGIWEREFATTPAGEEARDAGLLRVDYVAQTMQYEEMLSWLYYVSLFDVAKTPQIEIADPLGLVYSQAIESRDKKFRVTLSSSAAAQTLSARFLQGFLGAGVQHIALETHDILSSAARLEAYGLEILPIPPNYYEDLAARFDLSPGLLEKLAAYNILYDRDGEGECLQLYSRAFAKRFFFEIVERRDYQGYGGANAAVRLAAQSRYRTDQLV